MRQYDENNPDTATLEKAMQAIIAILNKYDLAGVVHLHTPGGVHFLQKLDPSYSAFKHPDGSNDLVFSLDVVTDCNNDVEEYKRRMKQTLMMLGLLAQNVGNTSVSLIDILEKMNNAYPDSIAGNPLLINPN